MIRAITANFALMTLAGVALAWLQPALFTWMTDGSIRLLGQPLLSVALGVIMLAMGLTLSFADYRALAHMPKALVIDAMQARLAPVPAALSAVWHVVIGSLLAGWWRRKIEQDEGAGER